MWKEGEREKWEQSGSASKGRDKAGRMGDMVIIGEVINKVEVKNKEAEISPKDQDPGPFGARKGEGK